MLEFKQNDTAVDLILTLTENVSIANPFYLFVFIHVLTKDVVSFVLNSAEDESFYTERYNRFTINPAVLFSGKQPGEWHYTVYEQVDGVNVSPLLSGEMLEFGKMILDRDVEFSFTQYQSPTTYQSYNG